jgi:hypothetical protein
MKISRCVASLAMITAIAPVHAFASPAASLSLAGLLGEADAVVVGTAYVTALSGTNVAISLVISRVVKGIVGAGTSLPVTWSLGSTVPFSMGTTGTGIWFLKQQGSSWIVLPVTAGEVPLSAVYISLPSGPLPIGYAYGASLPSANRLANEIAVGVQDPVAGVQLAHIAASGAIDGLGSGVLLPIWTQLSSSSVPLTRAVGLAGQIRLGLPAPLAVLAGADPGAFTSDAQDHLSASICRYTGSDSGAVGSLGALAQSAYADNLRFCAIHALREIHSSNTLAYLAPLLDSSSSRIQYEAVAGIASFANALPIQTSGNTTNMSLFTIPQVAPFTTADTQKFYPTLSAFALQPQIYVTFWKNWLLAHAVN